MYNTSQHLQTILDKHVILFFFLQIEKNLTSKTFTGI